MVISPPSCAVSSFRPQIEKMLFNQFQSVLKLIIFSYNELVNNNENFTVDTEGNDINNGMNLENSITNVLVHKYIINNRKENDEFKSLKLLHFDIEPASIDENFKTLGLVDIKVNNVTLKFKKEADESFYYCFECKRLRNSNYDKYVKQGILRFIDEKYLGKFNYAGMIGYYEEKNFEIEEIITKINNNLHNKYKKGELKSESNLDKYDLNYNFEHCYVSEHDRLTLEPIKLYHLILDYRNIIKLN